MTWNNIWKSKEQKCRLLVDNTANQDTEKVFQTVSVASVERTALAAATEDHVWAKASSVRMAAKKRACRTESETCQGNLFLNSWERTFYWEYVLMWVKFYYYPLIAIDLFKNFLIAIWHIKTRKQGQPEPAAAPANSERRWDASRTNSATPQTSAWWRQLAQN